MRVSTQVKANARYICQECGSTEFIQGHHQKAGDDSTIICLCAECHSQKHPNLPRALFFSERHQPYWFNKSASSLAKEIGVHPRTIIRLAKKYGVLSGELTTKDELFIKLFFRVNGKKRRNTQIKLANIQPRNSYCYFCSVCNLHWVSFENGSFCPLKHKLPIVESSLVC